MKRTIIAFSIVFGLMLNICQSGEEAEKTLDNYSLDMAGDASNLIVTPLDESILNQHSHDGESFE